MIRCLLNIDLGELAGELDELYRLADIANIACGGHAGDAASMTHALMLCKRYATHAGAHPSYPDRQNFGRNSQDITPEHLTTAVAEQCGRLAEHAARQSVQLDYVKPHGALYHDANAHAGTALAIVAGATHALGDGICLIGPADGALEAAARNVNIAFAREGFADRARRADGSLVPRTEVDAVIADPATARALALKLVRTGLIDTLCVHGDSPNAVAIARAVRKVLNDIPP